MEERSKYKHISDAMLYDMIIGQVVSKANNYLSVPDGQGQRRIIKSQRLRDYEESFCEQVKNYKGKGINQRFRLYIDVWQCSVAYDLDNSIKTILDCLQYADAITDDKLCYQIRATKHIDKQRPRVRFAIECITPELDIFADEV